MNGMKKFSMFEDVDITQMASATQSQVTEVDKKEEETTEVTETEVTKSDPAKFFSKLFESREIAHIFHLQSKGDQGSYGAHVALNEYYDGILELIDTIIEVYQGQYEIVEGYDSIDNKETSSDRIQYFISLAEFVKTTRYSAILKEDAHLQAIIDEILILIYKTLYKLRFNK